MGEKKSVISGARITQKIGEFWFAQSLELDKKRVTLVYRSCNKRSENKWGQNKW
jgi:hypothetical protein